MKIKTKIFVVAIALIFLLAITKPGMQKFKNFDPENDVYKQTKDYLIFSVYESSYYDQNEYKWHSASYVGILLNFYKLEQ